MPAATTASPLTREALRCTVPGVGNMDRPVIAADRLHALDNKARTEELHHYLARLFGLVGVISPIGISSAVTERQTPLPSICLPEDQEKASSVG
jgi:hypothetical protein